MTALTTPARRPGTVQLFEVIVMKQFSCGDVVPGCRRQFTADDEDGILRQVAEHARLDHGLDSLPPELTQQISALISA